MIGYLSGPITGHKDYRRQFAKAAAALKEMGYNVINPAAIDDAIPVECMSYEEIMRIDLELRPLLTTWCSFPAGSDPSAPAASWASPWAPTRSSSAWSSFSRRR